VSRRERLDRVVAGALRDVITQHGPIEDSYVRSASKRIVGQILSEEQARPNDAAKATIDHLHGRLAKLRHGHERTLSQNTGLRKRVEELEAAMRAAVKSYEDAMPDWWPSWPDEFQKLLDCPPVAGGPHHNPED